MTSNSESLPGIYDPSKKGLETLARCLKSGEEVPLLTAFPLAAVDGLAQVAQYFPEILKNENEELLERASSLGLPRNASPLIRAMAGWLDREQPRLVLLSSHHQGAEIRAMLSVFEPRTKVLVLDLEPSRPKDVVSLLAQLRAALGQGVLREDSRSILEELEGPRSGTALGVGLLGLAGFSKDLRDLLKERGTPITIDEYELGQRIGLGGTVADWCSWEDRDRRFEILTSGKVSGLIMFTEAFSPESLIARRFRRAELAPVLTLEMESLWGLSASMRLRLEAFLDMLGARPFSEGVG